MQYLSNTAHFSLAQRVAFVVGSALVNWAERTAQRTAALCPDAEGRERRERRRQHRRAAEARREQVIAELHLSPRGF